MASGNGHYIFNAISNTASMVLVELYYNGSSYQVRGAVRTDAGGWQYTPYSTLTDARHYIEVDWRASSAAGMNNGSLTLWLDGVQVGLRSGVDNDTLRVDSVQLGATMSVDVGTRGTYFFDGFESRRLSYIGPEPATP